MFSSTLGITYQEQAEKQSTGAVPDNGKCNQSWKETWSNPRRHNEEGEWMENLGNLSEPEPSGYHEDRSITKIEVQETKICLTEINQGPTKYKYSG